MIQAITDQVKGAAKAYVAVATPIITAAVAELVGEFGSALSVLIAAVLTGIVTYAIPNKP